MSAQYSTESISQLLYEEIKEALSGLNYGSVEIFVTGGEVTQITRRQIKKTNKK
jgi:hypothetical protein